MQILKRFEYRREGRAAVKMPGRRARKADRGAAKRSPRFQMPSIPVASAAEDRRARIEDGIRLYALDRVGIALICREAGGIGHRIRRRPDDHLSTPLALRHNAIAKLQSTIAANDPQHIVKRLIVFERII